MTKHIRDRIKKNGIKASVRKMRACGTDYIRVSTVKHDQAFSLEEQFSINRIALANGLTKIRGLEIAEETPFGNETSLYL